MAHIHEKYDYTVTAFIVYQQQILLIHHKQLNTWLPVGGHIELDEDPEQALYREIEEECGIKADDLELLSQRKGLLTKRTKPLPIPEFFDVHQINQTHSHIGFGYVLKAKRNKVTLAEAEHHDIQWVSLEQLENDKWDVFPEIKHYCIEAILMIKTQTKSTEISHEEE